MEELVIDFGDAGTQVFHVGDGSVAVPGLLAGLEEIHGRFATRAWADLVEPAVRLAETGFERDEQRETLHLILEGILQRDDGGRRIYGDPARVHTRDACETLEAVRDDGAAMVAELLPEYADDLRAYRVLEMSPLELARPRASHPLDAVAGRRQSSSASSSSCPDTRRSRRSKSEARAVADAYGPLGLGAAARHNAHLRRRRRRPCRGALLDARVRLGRLPRRNAAEQHARRARRHRPRREGARRPAREHDDPDARPRVGPARSS